MTAAQGGVSVIEAYGRLPLGFEKNMGQAPAGVDFLARGPGYLIETGPDAAIVRGPSGQATLRFLGANRDSRGEGQDRLKGESNYLVGPSPALWRTQVRSFRQVVYRGLYPGIDLVYYGNNGELEFDLVAEPGASLAKIQIAVEGTDELRVDAEGGVVLHAGGQEIRLRAPLVYQDRAGARTYVRSRYAISGGNRIRFELGDYDSKRPLVIDPVLVYSTYLGGSRDDRPYGIAVDPSGCAYLIGETWSLDFPRINAVQSLERGDRDVFVAKVSADGASLVYSTYLGGKGYDSGRAIALDASGAAYLTGFTWSQDFPVTSGVFRSTPSGQADVFVAKLNPSGNGLVYSTYIGGTGADTATSIAVDLSGNAYVAGYTSSTDFPVSHAYQSSFRGGFNDAFALEVNASGSTLIYSTYLGGSGNDIAQGLAVTPAGEAFVVGSTDSSDFPTVNALQPANAGGLDTFVVKLSAFGSTLAYSTYLGGSSSDMGNAIALDSSGAAYITGATISQNFPSTPGALYHAPDLSYDTFVAKLTPDAHLAFAARFGGNSSEQGSAVAVDASGNTYVAGYTYSFNFPALSGVQPALGGSSDAFLTGLNPSGTAFLFSTFLGGAGDDQATGLAIDTTGNLYATGFTLSGNFPTTATALRRSIGGGLDSFAIKFSTGVTGGGPPPAAIAAVGVFDNGLWYLATNTGSLAKVIGFGQAGQTPVVGDWDGTGTTKIGVFGSGLWFLANSAGGIYKIIGFGGSTAKPVVGDWDGDGTTNIGVFDHGIWYLANSAGSIYKIIGFGSATAKPVVGDWDGNGTTNIGVFENGIWYLANDSGGIYKVIGLGSATAKPVVGDWDGNGTTNVGVFDNGVWFLANDSGGIYKVIGFGGVNATPVVGRW